MAGNGSKGTTILANGQGTCFWQSCVLFVAFPILYTSSCWHAVCVKAFVFLGRSAKRWPVMTILESWKTLPEEWIVLLQLLGRQ